MDGRSKRANADRGHADVPDVEAVLLPKLDATSNRLKSKRIGHLRSECTGLPMPSTTRAGHASGISDQPGQSAVLLMQT